MITAERLREVLKYDTETGEFTWIKNTGFQRKIGKKAGHIQTTRGLRRLLVGIDGKHYKAHRLAWLYMTGEWPPADIDHINGDPCDNRWGNLRSATRSQNLCNMAARGSKSGMKGVFPNNGGTWFARIRKEGKIKYLGNFPTKEEAHMAYVRAAEIMHGEFACDGKRG